MTIKNIRSKQHLIRFEFKQRMIQHINFFIHSAIHNKM